MAWRGDPKKVADLIVGTTQSVGDSEAVGGSATISRPIRSTPPAQGIRKGPYLRCTGRPLHKENPCLPGGSFSNLLDVNHADSFQTDAA